MLHKRRIKPLLQKIMIFVGTFVLTVGVLAVIYIPSYGKKPTIISPVSLRVIHTKEVKKQDEKSLEKHAETLLKQYTIDYQHVQANKDNTIVVTLIKGEEVILSSTKNIESQISSLQLMLNRLTIDGEAFKRLDFRFDRPVISF